MTTSSTTTTFFLAAAFLLMAVDVVSASLSSRAAFISPSRAGTRRNLAIHRDGDGDESNSHRSRHSPGSFMRKDYNHHHQQQRRSSYTKRQMIPVDYVAETTPFTNIILSTVSADIDSIADDQFGLVFAGGIAVMAGGLFSALMVGFLLESNNSYASVVADSYSQQENLKGGGGGVDDNEEFWSKLSPEDQVKARELIDKLRASKNGGNVDADGAGAGVGTAPPVEAAASAVAAAASAVAATQVEVVATKVEKKETASVGGKSANKNSGADSMFSDYDD